MPANIVKLADDIKDLIVALGLPGVTIERKLVVRKATKDITGKNVWVFPLGYADIGPSDRDGQIFEYPIGIVYAEKYTQAGEVPDTWIDERIEFVETNLFVPLNQHGIIYGAGSDHWVNTAEVSSLYDVENLTQFKLFWTELQFAYRRIL